MFKNLSLYLSAFAPMYVLVFVKLVVEILNGNLTFNVLNTINFILLILLIGLGTAGLFWNVKFNRDEAKEIVILKKENITDKHFLGYFSLFVFFAIPLDLSKVSNFCVFILVLVFIGIVYINNSLYYINPLLNLLGYNFYDIEYYEVGQGEVRTAKIFFRGNLIIEHKRYWVKLKNKHFCFVDKSHKNS